MSYNGPMGIDLRYEKFPRIREILSSHLVLLEELTITCSHKSVLLGGLLKKKDHSDYTAQEIKNLIEEISRVVPHVSSQLANWDLNNGRIHKIGGDKNVPH